MHRTTQRAVPAALAPALLPALLLALAIGQPAAAQTQADPALTQLCASNPAYSEAVMREALESQLQKDHDPELDKVPPAELARQAVVQAIDDCTADLTKTPAIRQVLTPLTGSDLAVAWDAYNTACADHSASKAACIQAEIGAVHALKHLTATDQPPGAKTLVEACELILQPDPAMADWRECVDQGLAVHASKDAAAKCKLAVSWHTAKTGADAGHSLAACLARAGG